MINAGFCTWGKRSVPFVSDAHLHFLPKGRCECVRVSCLRAKDPLKLWVSKSLHQCTSWDGLPYQYCKSPTTWCRNLSIHNLAGRLVHFKDIAAHCTTLMYLSPLVRLFDSRLSPLALASAECRVTREPCEHPRRVAVCKIARILLNLPKKETKGGSSRRFWTETRA